MKAPCQGCIDRKMNCHAECIKYKTYRDQQDKVIESRHKDKVIDDFVINQVLDTSERMSKKIKKSGRDYQQ